jgi:glycosyltransferase involved in cell wall biosynthesis
MSRAHDRIPLVSFALPVRNGGETIAAAIDSVRAQTIDDWELVVSDNLSTDETTAICASYAREDERIRHIPTGRDLSLNENFSEAFRHTRGRYVRWYGDDDWLEDTYAERTVAALEAAPDAVLCTTLFRYYDGDAPTPLNDRRNALPDVDGADPVQRLIAFLHVYENAGFLGIDPIYSLAKREAAARTALITPYNFGDFIYSCEMALQGAFVHVPEVLAYRSLAPPFPNVDGLRRLTGRKSWTRYLQREVSLLRVWEAAGATGAPSRRRLVGPLVGFALREHAHGLRRRARGLVPHRSATTTA